jgi:hypothetical protein
MGVRFIPLAARLATADEPWSTLTALYESRNVIMLRIAPILVGLMALSSQAFASGPIYTYRYELPPAIARLHTCIGPRQRTLRYPDLWRVGKRRMFRIGCPENAPNITRLPHRDDSGYVRKPDDDPDQFQSTVYYLADNERGRNAKRLVLPYPRADGTTLMADAFDEELNIGWSARANTSLASGVAYLDLTGTAIYPPGEFMIATRIVPADRPEIKNVFAMWRIKGDKAELIYWAETRETLPKDAPSHQSPPYTIVLDKRPER